MKMITYDITLKLTVIELKKLIALTESSYFDGHCL